MIRQQRGQIMYDYTASVLDGYIECALWSETDNDGQPLDSETDTRQPYTRDSIDDASYGRMRADVVCFVTNVTLRCPDVLNGIDPGQVGHDFWLTRNGHGAGFWDRGLAERGDWLTQQCRTFGEAHLTETDDGTLYYA